MTYTEELEERIEKLEDENGTMDDELFELRGPVPFFPSAIYADNPDEYVKIFNLNRHLKEIPQ